MTASVPSTGSIEERAKALKNDIEKKASGKTVNLIGYVMLRVVVKEMISG